MAVPAVPLPPALVTPVSLAVVHILLHYIIYSVTLGHSYSGALLNAHAKAVQV